MITTISFYDFDGTLMNTPMPDSGREIWKEKTGTEYPHVGWWSRADSLNPEVFDIQPFPSVLNQLRSDTAKSDTYTVMLTSRLVKLEPQIKYLLDMYNIVFDDLSLKKGSDDEKSDRIKEYLEKFPDVHTINVYDDRDKEMRVLSKMKMELEDQYQINIYCVTDGKYSLVESVNEVDKIIFEEIRKIINESEVKHGLVKPDELKSKSSKIDEVSLGSDKDGFFVYTHRARSKSYKTPESIPVKDIEFIASTG